VPAAANLFGRAAAVLPEDARTRLELLPEYGEALLQLGSFDDAVSTLQDAIRLSDEAGLAHVAAHAALVNLLVSLRAGDPDEWRKEAAETIAEAMAVFEVAEDHAGLAKAWRLLAWTHGTACDFGKAAEASELALEEARAAGDPRQATRAATAYAAAAVLGSTPVNEAIARSERAVEEVRGDRQAEGIVLALRASLLAMRGSFDEARASIERAYAILEELDLPVELASAALEAWRVESFAGDLPRAEAELRRAHDMLVAVGERFVLCSITGLLGQTVYALGRYGEAAQLAEQSKELASEGLDDQALWRCLRAKVLAQEGAFDEAESLIDEAIAMLEPTDATLFQYGAYLDQAEIRGLAGREEQRAESLAHARTLAEAKGSTVLTGAVATLATAPAEPLPS
jgi:tetratricopeptide (TPR) repeat protein